VGLSTGEIVVAQGQAIIEKWRTAETVVDLCVQPGRLLVLTQNSLMLFAAVDDRYFNKPERKVSLDGYHPTKLQPTLNENIYVMATSEGELLRTDL